MAIPPVQSWKLVAVVPLFLCFCMAAYSFQKSSERISVFYQGCFSRDMEAFQGKEQDWIRKNDGWLWRAVAAKFISAQTSSLLYKIVQGLVIQIASILWMDSMMHALGSIIKLVICMASETHELP